jgi:hypothetical protein
LKGFSTTSLLQALGNFLFLKILANIATSSQKTHELFTNIANHSHNVHYIRLNPNGVGAFGLDECDEYNLKEIENLTEIYVNKRIQELNQIKKLIEIKLNK